MSVDGLGEREFTGKIDYIAPAIDPKTRTALARARLKNPDGVLRDSFLVVPGAPGYDTIAADNGSADYAETDIAGAQALLEEAGITTPIPVRMLFADNNPRRANQYAAAEPSPPSPTTATSAVRACATHPR